VSCLIFATIILMYIFACIYIFVVGTAFGSFVLAMVDRMKTGKDWVRGRSECDKCKNKLQPIDLIPIVSWLSTGGKCRYCGIKLSKLYPITELTVGLAFLFSFVFWPYAIDGLFSIVLFVVWLFAIVIMSGLFLFDIRWFTLPNVLIRPLIATGIIWMVIDVYNQGLTVNILLNYLGAILVGSGIFLLLYIVSSGKWIGDGDIRFGIAIGLFTGTPLESWFTIFLASALGIIASIPLLINKSTKNRLKIKIPFGPVLILALYITVLFGAQIIDWYKVKILYL
jgi:prepilin signal peptidase PulO-like enzyme (type II secretory pathway)